MLNLSPRLEAFLAQLPSQPEPLETQDFSHSLFVSLTDSSALSQKAAGWYEKVRNLLDYQEENQIRRRAIERILKRHLMFGKRENLGQNILEELISAGYIKNNSIPESYALTIESLIEKYENLGSPDREQNDHTKKWLLSMTAIEINALLFPRRLDEEMLEFWYEYVKNTIHFHSSFAPERASQALYIACRRSLLENSDAELYFAFWQKYIPEKSSISPSQIDQITRAVHDPLSWHLTRKIKNYRISALLIEEIVRKYGSDAYQIIADETLLEKEIAWSLKTKYEREIKQAKSSGLRAILYLLFTKVLIALIVEVPLDSIFLGHIEAFALAVNLIFPILLLLTIVRWPLGLNASNTKKIINLTEAFVADSAQNALVIKPSAASTTLSTTNIAFYGFIYTVTFSFIIGLLVSFMFQPVSIALFIIFLTLVSYFGMRVRNRALKWRYEGNDKGFFALIGNLFSLPVIRLGRWLSESFSSINALVFFMDFVIETPFKMMLQEFNHFMTFLKDRADELA
jgi:hypothetical protein